MRAAAVLAALPPAAALGRSVVFASARVTVLTPSVLRIERSDDGATTFVNRAPPVPPFAHRVVGGVLELNTSALRLRYAGGGFTTDCYVGWERCIGVYEGKMQPGVVSREGWAVIDDTAAPLLDGDTEWPPYGWRVPRRHAPGAYQDW
eukprot:gene28239-53081_t